MTTPEADQKRKVVLAKRRAKIDAELNEIMRRDSERRKAARCQWRWNTNQPCILDAQHDGRHRVPCANRGSHGAHREITAAHEEIVCDGRVFDAT